MKTTWLDQARLTIVVGHSGSGKTEFSVNLALAMADLGLPVTLADLDVVNPYFRSRERRDLLAVRGVTLIATSQACVDADVPVMPPELGGLIQDRSRWGVLDIGGGSAGARVLARYRPQLQRESTQVLLVLNANRPQTRDLPGALEELERIQATMGLTVTGLVNNTHLCGETTVEDILRGAALAEEVSRAAGIPVVCHAAPPHLFPPEGIPSAPLFPLDLYMKKPWEFIG